MRPGGVVIERTFADALGVSVGDRVSLNGKSFAVAGIAVTAAQSPYPNLCNGTLLGEHSDGVEVLERLPTVVQHPLSLAPGTQEAQQL